MTLGFVNANDFAGPAYNSEVSSLGEVRIGVFVGPLKPVRIRKDGDERLAIDWSDGKAGFVTWQTLRSQCPCAHCREEREKPADPFRILSEREVAAGLPRPLSMTPVGYYAYKIFWNDGHDSGIYTIENLRELCELEVTTQTPRN